MDLCFWKPLLLLCAAGYCAGNMREIEAVLGKKVTLDTRFSISNFVALVWNFNDGNNVVNVVTASAEGLKIHDSYKDRVTLNTTTGFLTIGPLTPADSGEFTITVISSRGTETEQVELRVLEPVSAVTITANMPEAIEHNSTVVLLCSAKGSFLTFSWFKGAAPIKADGKRITVKDEELSSALTIVGVLRTDLTEPVFCTAGNKLEKEKSAGFSLPVHYGPDEVTIAPLIPAQYIMSGANFSLSCSSRSSPAASFGWYHDKQMMEAGGPVLTLEVIKAHRYGSAMGEYTCRAKNSKTLREVTSAAVSFAVIDAMLTAKISGPSDTMPSAILIAGNSSANLSCQAAGGVPKTVTWLKDGKPLTAGGRLAFYSNMSGVAISPLQKEDNGEYMCRLVNSVSTVEASYKMLVNYGPETPMVTGGKAVEVNDKVELDCAAASVPPATYTWKFNGTMTSIKTAKYLIEMARYKNTGTYTCEAHNAVTGKNSSYAHALSVKEEGALDEGLSDGAIAGIVIAVLVALGAAIALIVYCRQKVPVESPY